MTELLYNKSKAVAALNKVEGFNPLELARRISNEGEAEQLYLDVKYRKLWFRLLNPTGKIISNIISLTENMAVVEARVYLDKCDQKEDCVGNSYAQRFRTADPKFGDKFLELAETAATGRALADACCWHGKQTGYKNDNCGGSHIRDLWYYCRNYTWIATSLSDLHEDCDYSFWWLVEYSFYYYCYGAFIGCFFVHYINSYSSKAHT